MKKMKLFFHRSATISFMIMMFTGSACGASVTMQREVTPPNDQGGIVIKKDMNMENGNQLQFLPERLNDKKDAGRDSEKGPRSVSIQRYKPSEKGEGERKMK